MSAVDEIHDLAKTANDPDSYEVLANLIKTAVDVNEKQMGIHRTRKTIFQKTTKELPKAAGNPTTQTNVYVGNSRDLLNMIKDAKKGIEPVNVSAIDADVVDEG